MILASLAGGGLDGTLVVVSSDRTRFLVPPQGPRTMQQALDTWAESVTLLEGVFESLDDPTLGSPVDGAVFAAPLPRVYHWAEGSSYLSHMERIRGGRGEALPDRHRERPIVYQSGGAPNWPPRAEVPLPDETWELDYEPTVFVVTGDAPQGTTAAQAPEHIKLVGITNDVTYRRLLVEERRQGTGTYGSKPGRGFAPFLVTPATLGTAWQNSFLRAALQCSVNGTLYGAPRADRDFSFGLPQIIGEFTRTRPLIAGSMIGTGTISNGDTERGFGCIAEKRGVEIMESGAAVTPFLSAGDTVTIEAIADDGTSLFGLIQHTVTRME
ncbi:fumarylacetoacetate hydrolase family protein [Dactylosporangium sp. AC04546]|uniref:fumarylacetoacetate hydrolase family protein n=1 Tax=Dactylosporangium sp. AC04546 TaxID=2862460 RepID=UPI001EE14580|nr:fumarylacetoacetate hydrolase family protein [Dactylosporangium sp. AC04546]WVK86443.1 fumarylacetoacetate hydrolase family protein [Dactylosporangium sp. AC04546]